MYNNIGVTIGIIAMLVFHIKLFLYYKLKNPQGSIFIAYVKGNIFSYIILSFFPISLKKYTNFSEVKRLNYLTYLFYILIFISFSFGYIGLIKDIKYIP